MSRNNYSKFLRKFSGQYHGRMRQGFLGVTLSHAGVLAKPAVFNKVMSNITNDMNSATKAQLLTLGKRILERSNQYAPIDTGNLVESGIVGAGQRRMGRNDLTVWRPNEGGDQSARKLFSPGAGRDVTRRNFVNEKEHVQSSLRKQLMRNDVAMRVSYSAEYALFVHSHHKSQANFLDRATNEVRGGVTSRIAKATRSSLGGTLRHSGLGRIKTTRTLG